MPSGLAELAVNGGRPVRAALLPYGRQTISDDDIRAVVAVLRSDWLTTGPNVDEFERRFAERVGARYAVAYSSGTAALHGAAFAAGLGPGDEAVTTPMTFAATANCVLYQGARPVFADVRADTLNLDPACVLRALTPRTRAILPVDYTGQPADLDEITAIARSRGLVVIEDAAHSAGATYRGKPIGGLADLTTFSFHPVKHITTGEGGMVTTNDAELSSRLRAFRNHGITSDARERQMTGAWWYEMASLGYNYRLTDIQAALGTSQLAHLDEWVARRRAIAASYSAAFAALSAVEVPSLATDRESAWHLYVLRLRLDRLSVDRATVFRALRAENIQVNVHYIPVPWHPYYRQAGYERGAWPVAEAAYERLITLPLFSGMTDDDARDVIDAVGKVISAYAVA